LTQFHHTLHQGEAENSSLIEKTSLTQESPALQRLRRGQEERRMKSKDNGSRQKEVQYENGSWLALSARHSQKRTI
jgi:hypothetical protein